MTDSNSKEGMSVGAFFLYLIFVVAGMFLLAAMLGKFGDNPDLTPAPSVSASESWVSWTP